MLPNQDPFQWLVQFVSNHHLAAHHRMKFFAGHRQLDQSNYILPCCSSVLQALLDNNHRPYPTGLIGDHLWIYVRLHHLLPRLD